MQIVDLCGASQSSPVIRLEPGSGCEFQLAFAPETLGVFMDDSMKLGCIGNEVLLNLKGQGVEPPLEFDPPSLDFGTQGTYLTSPEMQASLINRSSEEIVLACGDQYISSTEFKGEETCSGIALKPGEACPFSFSFIPAEDGPRHGAFNLRCNGIRLAVALQGEGETTPFGGGTPNFFPDTGQIEKLADGLKTEDEDKANFFDPFPDRSEAAALLFGSDLEPATDSDDVGSELPVCDRVMFGELCEAGKLVGGAGGNDGGGPAVPVWGLVEALLPARALPLHRVLVARTAVQQEAVANPARVAPHGIRLGRSPHANFGWRCV